MTSVIPVIDLAAATAPDAPQEFLDQIREATETVGIIQVLNHGVPTDLISEFDQRIERLLDLPRDRKAQLTSPTGHPYRGWRQWPDDFGRLELERFNVGQFDNVEQARAAGLAEEYLGLYAHDNVWPDDDPELHDLTFRYIAAGRSVAERVLGLYARAQGLPEDTFPVGPLPYLSFTVNNYPTWTRPAPSSACPPIMTSPSFSAWATRPIARCGPSPRPAAARRLRSSTTAGSDRQDPQRGHRRAHSAASSW